MSRSRHAIAEMKSVILVNSVASSEEKVDDSIAALSRSAFLLGSAPHQRVGDPARARGAIANAALDDPARINPSANS